MNEYDEEKRIFARNLTKHLAMQGLLQADLVRALKTTSASVGYWCTGKQIPRMNTIQAICDFLHINKSDLLEDHENDDPAEVKDEEILNMIKKLSEDKQKMLRKMIEAMIEE